MKKLTVLFVAVITAIFAGCASTGVQVSPIGFEAAKAAALEAAGVASADAVFGENELKEFNGQQYYDIDFRANGNEYEYDIDALTGAVIASEKDVKAPAPADKSKENQSDPAQEQSKNDLIGEEKAKAAALKAAGVKEADAKFVRAELDRDDGRTVYEIEFYSGNTEYDYDIDAYNGEVLSYDHDAEHYSAPKQSQPAQQESKPENDKQQNVLSEADAKKVALAQVPGAKESDIREFEVDRDDGRIEYEGKIVYDGLEYEFEIDGHSGAIRNWEVEKFEKFDD